MITFSKTYALAEGPAPMQWPEYEAIVSDRWRSLLDDPSKQDECYFQEFLEMHPSMIPGPFGLIGTSGHSPSPASVISQPVLPDFTRKVPDFLWIARNSDTVYPVLVEIESPAKPWFTAADIQHSKLTQARNQLAEWKMWFGEPLNTARFADYYRVSLRSASLRPLYVLIYGRRAEANLTEERAKKRANLAGTDEFLLTYDRLVPQRGVTTRK